VITTGPDDSIVTGKPSVKIKVPGFSRGVVVSVECRQRVVNEMRACSGTVCYDGDLTFSVPLASGF
jgi:hypothetical protein